MAGLANLLGQTVYLDTNIFIYAVEGYEPEEAFLRELFAALDQQAFTAVTSELTLAELLVKPFALGQEDVAEAYVNLLQPSERLVVVPVERSILITAARERAALGMLLPDAIHVATAIASGCTVFLTNDRRLKLPPTVAVELL